MKSLRYAFAFACLAPVALVACASGEPSSSDDGPVGEGVAAFGEAACGTDASAHDYTTISGNFGAGCPGGKFEGVSTSADSTYGDSACASAYIVQYTGTVSGDLSAFGAWAGSALTSSNCNSAIINVDVYNSAGTMTGSASAIGTWQSLVNACDFSPSGGWPGMTNGTNSRIVAQAGFGSCTSKGCTFTSYVPVTVELFTPEC